jgi:Ca2+:H+ antiporter
MRDLADALIRPLDFGRTAPFWSWLAPVVALGALAFTGLHIEDGAVALTLAVLIVPAVMAAVHHAEVIAVKVGEPLGTLVLALAVTVIECALIITLMLSKPEESASLVRDTVYSAVMIILGGVVGLCLLVGAARHHVLRFGLDGVSAATVTLVAMSGLVLILPDYTLATEGPYFSTSQLLLVGAACLVLWGMFVFVQTVRHRDYFLPEDGGQDAHHGSGSCTTRQAWLAGGLLLACLVAVVLLAKSLSDPLATIIVASGAPLSAVGVVIAGVVLLPESVAAVRAAAANRLQTSLNLALGSSLATIGLTVPVIAVLSVIFGWRLELGLEPLGITLLALMLFVASLSLATGRTTVQQGAVHLVIFAVFLFTSFNP